jgi:hypothetical protein
MAMRELSAAECRALLVEQRIGRLVYTDNALPTALPVNYALDGDGIVFRTAATGRLASAVTGSVVAFEVDAIDEASASGWSVLIVGFAHRIVAPDELMAAQRLGIVAWGASDASTAFLRIPLSRVTGRWVQGIEPDSGGRDHDRRVSREPTLEGQ